MGIGWLYQRLLFPAPRPADAPAHRTEDAICQRRNSASCRQTLLSMTGLDFLQGVIDGRCPRRRSRRRSAFRSSEVEQGRAVFEGVPQIAHYNPIGIVHGGFAMTLLDSALACAMHTTLDKGEAYTTLEIKVNLVRPLTKETGLVRAEGRVLHRGRTRRAPRKATSRMRAASFTRTPRRRA